MQNNIFIGVGANLQQPMQQVLDALTSLNQHPDIVLQASSSLYSSAPMGPSDQPDYINAVIQISTDLTAHALLDVLQSIEQQQGRVRKDTRWGPRTLDLDILLFNDLRFDDDRLTIPHYGMAEREFVLYPLAEIVSDLIMPDGQPISKWLDKCPRGSLQVAMPQTEVTGLVWQSV